VNTQIIWLRSESGLPANLWSAPKFTR